MVVKLARYHQPTRKDLLKNTSRDNIPFSESRSCPLWAMAASSRNRSNRLEPYMNHGPSWHNRRKHSCWLQPNNSSKILPCVSLPGLRSTTKVEPTRTDDEMRNALARVTARANGSRLRRRLVWPHGALVFVFKFARRRSSNRQTALLQVLCGLRPGTVASKALILAASSPITG